MRDNGFTHVYPIHPVCFSGEPRAEARQLEGAELGH